VCEWPRFYRTVSTETMGKPASSEFASTLTPETCDYSILRRDFGDWLESVGVERAMVDDWRLILTELATNACEASPPGATITCRATITHNKIELCVSNPTAHEPTVLPAQGFDPGATRGGGLFIVDAIVHGIEYDVGPNSVSIRCWTPLARF
jgi:anti-sigma regulatory factor (Ser/Thr protein kinase)